MAKSDAEFRFFLAALCHVSKEEGLIAFKQRNCRLLAQPRFA
jgi:hypothetical protein